MVLRRDRWTCQIRGPKCTVFATHVDHVIPRVDGGSVFDPANCRASCARCNIGRVSRRTKDRRSVGSTEQTYPDVRM
jgi:5-methylcytosine-specific restriction protein A